MSKEEATLREIIITISDYKKEMKSKLVYIFAFIIFFSAISATYAYFKKDKYSAVLSFVVEDQSSSSPLSAYSGIASQFGMDLGGLTSTTFSQNNVIELLKSRKVIESALNNEYELNGKSDLLINHYIEINSLRENWEETEELKGLLFGNKGTIIHDSISGQIWSSIVENKLIIESQTDDASILNLTYTSLSGEYAKYFTESLIAEMSEMYTHYQTEKSRKSLSQLESRLDSVFIELKSAERQYAEIKDENQRVIKASGRLKEIQAFRQVEVLNTMYIEIIKHTELAKMTLLNQTPIIQIIDKPILPINKTKKSLKVWLIIGAFLGFCISTFLIIIKKLFRDTLQEEQI